MEDTTSKTVNLHERLARLNKAVSLIKILVALEVTYDDLMRMNSSDDFLWKGLSLAAGVNPPSTETIEVIKDFFVDVEELRATLGTKKTQPDYIPV